MTVCRIKSCTTKCSTLEKCPEQTSYSKGYRNTDLDRCVNTEQDRYSTRHPRIASAVPVLSEGRPGVGAIYVYWVDGYRETTNFHVLAVFFLDGRVLLLVDVGWHVLLIWLVYNNKTTSTARQIHVIVLLVSRLDSTYVSCA